MRLIDADALIKHISDDNAGYLLSDRLSVIDIEKYIDDAPTVPQFGEWINKKDRLPENAKHKGANCEMVLVKTKWGITEGWYNPDVPCWFIIAIFMYYNDSEAPNLIDFKRGDIPKLVHVPDIDVTHWMPLPEPPKECVARMDEEEGK